MELLLALIVLYFLGENLITVLLKTFLWIIVLFFLAFIFSLGPDNSASIFTLEGLKTIGIIMLLISPFVYPLYRLLLRYQINYWSKRPDDPNLPEHIKPHLEKLSHHCAD